MSVVRQLMGTVASFGFWSTGKQNASSGYNTPALAMVWRVVYPEDKDNRSHGAHVLYDCILWTSRRHITAVGTGEFGSVINGDENILMAASENPTLATDGTDKPEYPNDRTTPFEQMQGEWVIIEYVNGNVYFPVIMRTIAFPLASLTDAGSPTAQAKRWVGNREKGRRRFTRFKEFEAEINNWGDVILRLLEPIRSVPDQNQNDKPDPDADPNLPVSNRRQREFRFYASDENDPNGVQVHFHKQHFGIKVASPGVDTATVASRKIAPGKLAVAMSPGTVGPPPIPPTLTVELYDASQFPLTGYVRIFDEDLPYINKVGNVLMLSPITPPKQHHAVGEEVTLLVATKDPYTPKVKWTNFFGVFAPIRRVFIGGASSTVCDQHGVDGDDMCDVLTSMATRIDQLETAVAMHTHATPTPYQMNPNDWYRWMAALDTWARAMTHSPPFDPTPPGPLTPLPPVVSPVFNPLETLPLPGVNLAQTEAFAPPIPPNPSNQTFLTQYQDWTLNKVTQVFERIDKSNMAKNVLSYILRLRKD